MELFIRWRGVYSFGKVPMHINLNSCDYDHVQFGQTKFDFIKALFKYT